MANEEGILPEHEKNFPHLSNESYRKTSEEDEKYNCIAYAIGDISKRWQPPIWGWRQPGDHWPNACNVSCSMSSQSTNLLDHLPLLSCFAICNPPISLNDIVRWTHEIINTQEIVPEPPKED